MVVNSLEFGRAQKQSRATSVRNGDEFGQRELTAAGTPHDDSAAVVISRLLRERSIERVAVPRYFPLAVADRLRAEGITLEVARQLDARRRTKRDDELEAL